MLNPKTIRIFATIQVDLGKNETMHYTVYTPMTQNQMLAQLSN